MSPEEGTIPKIDSKQRANMIISTCKRFEHKRTNERSSTDLILA